MTHAAGIIGHILVNEWMTGRVHPGAGGHGAEAGQRGSGPDALGLRPVWSVRLGGRVPSWPGYVASVRHMSRRVVFRRHR
ncbi:conserved hypothetical protein [Gluconacetobacter diazotrophicus PA1 5]|uniref:Uncharacterized protein n=2 Tax=Gluconacetobacter diazotrophicus TaxID=33996 RepID=A9H4U5_GLUDA|nr:hypothetical protein [Gluconacetobacter diazotrophicus]ACI52499.1 conserved hypothetical protein [Gluconacetobacter diazotrophicus PA1 5]MBB2156773.1 hypothetical protein [Gluconacetobacter diazotrophicus]TWB03110.1 hypothetical protein FBZ86_12221 [Gluconacetobacter diazotrophicus]CAP57486.1 hypothetical protein GDI3543 [Gluconacetobacter diazotrophicus PA1 5]